MNNESITVPKKRSLRSKILIALAVVLLLAVAAGWTYYHYTYPYGLSHACSKGLGLTLRLYANDYGGWLPYGQATPEESLALIDNNSAIWVLGGKNIPRAKVIAAFAEGHFGPEFCGWHYIEGLREDDNPQIAVVWDKVTGLGHNGQRWPGTMHEVVLLDGSIRFVSKIEWPNFVAKEKELLEQVIAGRETNAPRVRWSDEATLGTNRFPAPARPSNRAEAEALMGKISPGMKMAEIRRMVPHDPMPPSHVKEHGGTWYDLPISEKYIIQIRVSPPQADGEPDQSVINYSPRLRDRKTLEFISGAEKPW